MRPNKLFFFIMVLYGLVAGVSPAGADTDYRCLDTCINTGHSSSTACLKECEYGNIPADDQQSNIKKPNASQQFSTPVPTNGQIILPVHHAEKPVDIDYVCMTKCEKENMQYQLCEKRCDKNLLQKHSYSAIPEKPTP